MNCWNVYAYNGLVTPCYSGDSWGVLSYWPTWFSYWPTQYRFWWR